MRLGSSVRDAMAGRRVARAAVATVIMVSAAACGSDDGAGAGEAPPSGAVAATQELSTAGGGTTGAGASSSASSSSSHASSSAAATPSSARVNPSAPTSAAVPDVPGRTVTTADGQISVWVPDTWKQTRSGPDGLMFESADKKVQMHVSSGLTTNEVGSGTDLVSASVQETPVKGSPNLVWRHGFSRGQAVGVPGLVHLGIADRGSADNDFFTLGSGWADASIGIWTDFDSNASDAQLAALAKKVAASPEGKLAERVAASVVLRPKAVATGSCDGKTFDYGELKGVTCAEAKATITMIERDQVTDRGAHAVTVENGFWCYYASTADEAADPQVAAISCTKGADGGPSFKGWNKGKRPASAK